MFDPKKDISDIFEKGQKIIDGGIKEPIERITESEFKERVRKVIIEKYSSSDIIHIDKGWGEAQSFVPNINYSLDDVVSFIRECETGDPFGSSYSAGIYLSALINRVIKENDEIVINTKGIDEYNKSILENIGMCLPRGRIVFTGDAQGAIGYMMEGGEIVVNGNCFGEPAHGMKGGSILIKKDILKERGCFISTFGIGYGMEGGELEVLGNAMISERTGNWTTHPPQPSEIGGIGFDMNGGKIIVNGDVCDVGYGMKDGEIIIKGNVPSEHKTVGDRMGGGKIIVQGYVKQGVGWKMKGGRIIVDEVGDYYDRGGHRHCGTIGADMRGGEIIVNSSSFADVGRDMGGGIIEIKGNLRHVGIGNGMFDGKIVIYKDTYSTSGGEVAGSMGGGLIDIKGDIDTIVGNAMKGGIVSIDGNMPSDKSYRIRDQPWREGGVVYHRGVRLKENTNTKIGNFVDKLFGNK